MKYHTTNPSERVMSVSKNEAEQQFKRDHDIQNYFEILRQSFCETLKELLEAEIESRNMIFTGRKENL